MLGGRGPVGHLPTQIKTLCAAQFWLDPVCCAILAAEQPSLQLHLWQLLLLVLLGPAEPPIAHAPMVGAAGPLQGVSVVGFRAAASYDDAIDGWSPGWTERSLPYWQGHQQGQHSRPQFSHELWLQCGW
jgi:hypothetical protein